MMGGDYKPVVVIGGGPAGMMAAGQAALHGAPVLLLEQNGRLGLKLNITGKGRCNITNDCTEQEFLENIPGDGRFFRGALARFSPADTMAFFEGIGLPLKTERGRRVFPASGKAPDVTAALERWLDGLGVVRQKARATGLQIEGGAVTGVKAGPGRLPSGAVIVAAGGLSYPKTGSTGDGYRLARQAGHTVSEPRPSLVPLVSPDRYCGEMQGLSLRNVSLSLCERDGREGRAVWREGPGEMLFTHFGLSGPLALSASAHWRPGLHAAVDLKPGLTPEQLDRRLLRDFDQYAARNFQNALGDLLHRSMIPVIIRESGIEPRKKTAGVSKAERARLAGLVKAFPVRISGTRPIAEAVITRGGVNVRELWPKTMGSRLVPGLYFAGEVLDLDAYTGGYNLQIAWSTGFAAGIGAAEEACPG